MCSRIGFYAWLYGQKGNTWKKEQMLWWKGKTYKRESKEYQGILDRLYEACYTQNDKARATLLETGDAELTHERGKSDITDTVLTESEFISRLRKIRKELM